MVNSSLLVVATPQKKTISSKKVTVVDVCKIGPIRFSPSNDVIKVLMGLSRVHDFQFHREVSLVDMKKMSCLTKKVTEDIGQFFNSEVPDIPEVIFKLEEIATNVGYYSLFFKEYISEEFSTSTEFSFSILTVLTLLGPEGGRIFPPRGVFFITNNFTLSIWLIHISKFKCVHPGRFAICLRSIP